MSFPIQKMSLFLEPENMNQKKLTFTDENQKF